MDKGFKGPVGDMNPSDELRMVMALSWLRSDWVDRDLISETDVCQVWLFLPCTRSQPPSLSLPPLAFCSY